MKIFEFEKLFMFLKMPSKDYSKKHPEFKNLSKINFSEISEIGNLYLPIAFFNKTL